MGCHVYWGSLRRFNTPPLGQSQLMSLFLPSSNTAVDDFVLDPEFMVKMGHAALRQGVENIQHSANKLGSGGPIVGRQSAFFGGVLLLFCWSPPLWRFWFC